MAKIVDASDVIPGCAEVIRGQDERDVITRLAEHAREKHGLTLSPEVRERLRDSIRDV